MGLKTKFLGSGCYCANVRVSELMGLGSGRGRQLTDADILIEKHS